MLQLTGALPDQPTPATASTLLYSLSLGCYHARRTTRNGTLPVDRVPCSLEELAAHMHFVYTHVRQQLKEQQCSLHGYADAHPWQCEQLVLCRWLHGTSVFVFVFASQHTRNQLRLQQYTTPSVYVSSKLLIVLFVVRLHSVALP